MVVVLCVFVCFLMLLGICKYGFKKKQCDLILKIFVKSFNVFTTPPLTTTVCNEIGNPVFLCPDVARPASQEE